MAVRFPATTRLATVPVPPGGGELDPEVDLHPEAGAAEAAGQGDAAEPEDRLHLDEVGRRLEEPAVLGDDRLVVLVEGDPREGEALPEELRDRELGVEEPGLARLDDEAGSVDEGRRRVVAHLRPGLHRVLERAREVAEVLGHDAAVQERVLVRRPRGLGGEEGLDPLAHELAGSERGRAGEVLVEDRLGREAQGAHVETGRGLEALESGVQGHPGLFEGVEENAPVVGVGDVGLGPDALHTQRRDAAGSGLRLGGDTGPLEDPERPLGAGGPCEGHRHRRREIDGAPDVARGEALGPQRER